MATLVSARSERCRRSTWLRTGDSGGGIRADAWSGHASRWRRHRDRVCGRGPDADYGNGRCGDAEGRADGTGRRTAAVIPIASGVRVWIATGHTDMRRGT